MKKIVSLGMATLMATILLVSSAASQDLALNRKKEQKTFSAGYSGSDDVAKVVLKNFNKVFGERPDAVWTKTAEGFVVHFKDGKRSTNVYFSPKGAIDYRVNYYFEDELPREVRHTVKSNFYDYFITHVSEVHKGDFVCYFVKIEDKTSIKTVRVTDDEYEVIEELTKQL